MLGAASVSHLKNSKEISEDMPSRPLARERGRRETLHVDIYVVKPTNLGEHLELPRW